MTRTSEEWEPSAKWQSPDDPGAPPVSHLTFFSPGYRGRRRIFQQRLWQLIAGTLGLTLLLGHAHYSQAGLPTVHAVSQAVQQEITRLEPNGVVERELKGSDVHTFRVSLVQSQFLHGVVEQKGLDVVVTMFGPDRKQVFSTDSPNGSGGSEPVVMIAEASGEYLLEVRAANSKAAAGRYQLKMISLRESTPKDRDHAVAQRIFEEACRLRLQRSAASRRAAIEKYEQSLRLFRSAGELAAEALTLYSIGLANAESGEFRNTLELCNQALPLFRALGNTHMERATINLIGGAYEILGDPQRALDNYRQALALARSLENRPSEAAALNNIGAIYYRTSEWQQALDYFGQALSLFRAIKDQRREANALHNIGVSYSLLGEMERAADYLKQALPLRRAIGDKAGEASTLNSIGYVNFLQKDPLNALAHYNQALPLWRAAGDRTGEANTLDNIGIAHSALGQPEKALDYHHQALQLQRATENRRGEALSLGNIGSVYILSGQPQKAKQFSEDALSSFQNIGDKQNQAAMLHQIARAERDLGNLAVARDRINAALHLIETVRSRTDDQQQRTSYFASNQDAYEFYVDLLMRLHRLNPAGEHDAEALQISERARTRSLLEVLNEARIDIRQGVDAALIEQERKLAGLLNAKAQRQIQLLGQKNVNAELESLKREISDLEDQYRQTRSTIRKASPQYAALTQPQPLAAKEIQQLLDKDTLLLEYSIGGERSFVWAISQDSLKTYELPKRGIIEKSAHRVIELLNARSIRIKSETAEQRRARISRADDELQQAAAELSELVLRPVASELGGKRLVVVPDGALHYIPFAMLPVVADSQSTNEEVNQTAATPRRPLVVDHEIISLPSASTFAEHRKTVSGRKPAENGIAVIADPVFSAADKRVNARGSRPAELRTKEAASSSTARLIEHVAAESDTAVIPRLPYTRQEANSILAIAPAAANLKALDFKATRATALRPELGKYRYLHFGTHGYLNTEHPGSSAIVLSLVDERGRSQPGLLTTNDIYNLKLPAELVVLSACQTGLGKQFRGEGLVGLTRGFMYAGAARVVVSLWSVNDKATSELMQRFYRAMLKDGQRPATALRAAQVEMWQQKQWKSPYYWAAFTMQGEWR